MKKIKDNAHYHNIFKFEELEIILIIKKAWMNSDSVIKKANIMWAVKERFKQQEKNHNNQNNNN